MRASVTVSIADAMIGYSGIAGDVGANVDFGRQDVRQAGLNGTSSNVKASRIALKTLRHRQLLSAAIRRMGIGERRLRLR